MPQSASRVFSNVIDLRTCTYTPEKEVTLSMLALCPVPIFIPTFVWIQGDIYAKFV